MLPHKIKVRSKSEMPEDVIETLKAQINEINLSKYDLVKNLIRNPRLY